jgi:hypothetical protein
VCLVACVCLGGGVCGWSGVCVVCVFWVVCVCGGCVCVCVWCVCVCVCVVKHSVQEFAIYYCSYLVLSTHNNTVAVNFTFFTVLYWDSIV